MMCIKLNTKYRLNRLPRGLNSTVFIGTKLIYKSNVMQF